MCAPASGGWASTARNWPEGAGVVALGDPQASLVDWMDRQYRLSAAAMRRSISAVDLVKMRAGFGQVIRPILGSVVASPQLAAYDPDPDYFFHWFRDSAIVIDAAATLIADNTYGEDDRAVLGDFVRFSLAVSELDGRAAAKALDRVAIAPEFRQYVRPDEELAEAIGENVSGETRVNPDGTLDITKWGRPQYDGPALRALVVLRLLRANLLVTPADRLDAARLLANDLSFIRHRCTEPSFDIWEEELGYHYYTRLVQFAALSDGSAWLEAASDHDAARACREAADALSKPLDEHWDAEKGFYRSRLDTSPESRAKALDSSVLLAIIHARRSGGAHGPRDPKTLSTLTRLEKLFARDYPINAEPPSNRGVAMGRYAGDRYYSGGAYYFSTFGAAEFCYRVAEAMTRMAPLESAAATSDFASPETAVRKGDGFMAAAAAFTPSSGDLSEQFDQTDGRQTSAKSLAWSHAALITAVAARRAATSRRRPP
jgi:glucoamylase